MTQYARSDPGFWLPESRI